MKIKYHIDRSKVYEFSKKKSIDPRYIIPYYPEIKNPSDAGIDLFAAYEFFVSPYGMCVAETFVQFEIPSGMVGLIWPRGGDEFLIGSGVVDPSYRGTIKVRVINPYNRTLAFSAGSSLGQIVFVHKLATDKLELEESLVKIEGNTERGSDGRINREF